MKCGNGVFRHDSDEWETPEEVFTKLDNEFNFNLDPCATVDNHKCEKFYTAENDGLSASWGGIQCSVIHLIAR